LKEKAPRPVAALLGHGGFGHQLADRREQARVGGRVAARRAADRRLVDVDHLVEVLDALDRLVRRRLLVGPIELARHRRIERVVDQRGLARARHPGHAGEQPHRDLHRDVPQVVAAGAHDADHLRIGLFAQPHALLRHRDLQAAGHVAAGQRRRIRQHLRRRALRHHLAAVDAGAGPHVHHVVGRADHVLVVLHHQHTVAEVAQVLQGADQAVVVALVQADAGLVQHVHHPGEAGADLGGEPDALRLAAGERLGLRSRLR